MILTRKLLSIRMQAIYTVITTALKAGMDLGGGGVDAE